jgi:sporulation protein YlmC with PRC-barrel domain
VSTNSESAERGGDGEREQPQGGNGYQHSGDELLKLPVMLRDVELGRPVDLIVDLKRLRVVGLHVRCGDRARRFLPLAAALVGSREITAGSPLALLDESSFYQEHGVSLRSLRGTAVELNGRRIGTLADVVVVPGGEVTRVVVKNESGQLRRLRADRVRLAPPGRRNGGR